MKKFLFCTLAAVTLAAVTMDVLANRVRAQRVAAHPQCDANVDGVVNTTDINIIRSMVGMTVAPGGVGDPNFDGKVTINDVRACTLQCTNAGCN